MKQNLVLIMFIANFSVDGLSKNLHSALGLTLSRSFDLTLLHSVVMHGMFWDKTKQHITILL